MNSSTASASGTRPGADADAAHGARAHRLLGVEQQVQQRLLQLAAVAEDRRQPGLERGLHLDRVEAELVGAERQHAGHHVGDVLLGARRGLPPRERQQVADDLRGALRLLGDAPQVVHQAVRRAGVSAANASRTSSCRSCA